MLRRVGLVVALLVLVLAAPWPLLMHLLHGPTGQRVTNLALFGLMLFAVFRLPVLLVRYQRPAPPARRRRTRAARKPARD